jgi:hypothetical protein
MRKPLCPFLAATLAAMMLVALSAGQALADHVHCGDVLTQDTTLDSDLSCSSQPALTIGADNVTLDLGGHALRWQGSGIGTAVTATCCPGPEGVTVQNGAVQGGHIVLVFTDRSTLRGLRLTGGGGIRLTAGRALIEGNEILGVGDSGGILVTTFGGNQIRRNVITGGSGISLEFGGLSGDEQSAVTDNVIKGVSSGVTIFRSSAEIARNRILGNTGPGILFDVAYGDAVHDNVISGNRVGIQIYLSGIALRANVIEHNLGDGITAQDSSALNAQDNVLSRNGGNGITVGYNASLSAQHNVVSHNAESGVLVDGAERYGKATAQLVGNTISANALDGVHVGEFTFTRDGWGGPPLLEGNRTDRNGDDGIDTENADTTVTRSHAWFNGDFGVEAVPGVSGGGNWAKHNGNPAQCVPAFLCSTTGRPRG